MHHFISKRAETTNFSFYLKFKRTRLKFEIDVFYCNYATYEILASFMHLF